MTIKGFQLNEKFFFLGIGGISMSALAEFAAVNGYSICGFDDKEGGVRARLNDVGIEVFVRSLTKTVWAELYEASTVVYTDAIPKEHPLLQEAVRTGKKFFSRAEFLGSIADSFTYSIGIAGSHGKTTCTAMTAHVLESVGARFAAHIGGMDCKFGNFYSSGEEFFLTEACEYKKNLLKIPCDSAIVLNADLDHAECYSSEKELIETFKTFCEKANRSFVCADDQKIRELRNAVTFGVKNQLADYQAVNLRETGQKYQFDVQEYGKRIARIRLRARGLHNVYNALAAFAVARSYGFSEKEIVSGLEDFIGVKRRFEEIGEYEGIKCICDYAHHPKEILSTVSTAAKIFEKKFYVIFQPHTYSRTKFLMAEFTEVLRGIENLVIYKTFPAREFYDEAGSAKTLAENVGGCLYLESARELIAWIKRTVRSGETLLFLGAGDIYYVAERIVSRIK